MIESYERVEEADEQQKKREDQWREQRFNLEKKIVFRLYKKIGFQKEPSNFGKRTISLGVNLGSHVIRLYKVIGLRKEDASFEQTIIDLLKYRDLGKHFYKNAFFGIGKKKITNQLRQMAATK